MLILFKNSHVALSYSDFVYSVLKKKITKQTAKSIPTFNVSISLCSIVGLQMKARDRGYMERAQLLLSQVLHGDTGESVKL